MYSTLELRASVSGLMLLLVVKGLMLEVILVLWIATDESGERIRGRVQIY